MQLDDRAVDAVMTKLFKNYKTWCKYLGKKHSLRLVSQSAMSMDNFRLISLQSILLKVRFFGFRLPQGQQEVQQRKILYMGLYLLIWGEAANLRFMPECLCYIFHNVSIISGVQISCWVGFYMLSSFKNRSLIYCVFFT